MFRKGDLVQFNPAYNDARHPDPHFGMVGIVVGVDVDLDPDGKYVWVIWPDGKKTDTHMYDLTLVARGGANEEGRQGGHDPRHHERVDRKAG